MTNETYTGQQFEAVFFEAMHKWIQGGKIGPDPRSLVEFRTAMSYPFTSAHPAEFVKDTTYRWRPKRTVMIGGKELVAPEREAPKNGSIYWSSEDAASFKNIWGGSNGEFLLLGVGKIFLTGEDAEAMRVAQTQERLG